MDSLMLLLAKGGNTKVLPRDILRNLFSFLWNFSILSLSCKISLKEFIE